MESFPNEIFGNVNMLFSSFCASLRRITIVLALRVLVYEDALLFKS